jgi:hypothetical protein
MRQKTLTMAALFAVLTCFSGRVSAWNGHGHMVVAKIAYDQLSDGDKMKVGKILEKHPHFDTYLSKQKPSGVSVGEWAFLRAATWPDWIRGRNQPPEIAMFSKPALHFVDQPFVKPEDADSFDEKALQPTGDTILTGLPKFTKALKATDSDADRAVALCWVLHLVGDIHQPLHCASMYSAKFPKGDRGGNSQLVKVGSKTQPLHPYWDGLIGSSVKYGVIEADALDIARDPSTGTPEFKARTAQKDITKWAGESFKLAVTVAYLDGTLESQVLPHPRDEEHFTVPEVPDSYAPRARACARTQVALAGSRLAIVLKETLAE